MYLVYNLIFPLVFLFYLPFYLVHIFRRGGLTKEYWQRFGFFGADIKARLRELRHPVWIHAVSVGESIASVAFIKAWQKAHPEDEVVFSCSTATAYATMQKKNLAGVILIYCPFDFWWAIRHVVRLVHPHTLLIFEVEIWPNLVRIPASQGVKVCLVNGRMSDKSSEGYAKWPSIFQPIFNAFAALCVQTEEDAARIRRIIGPSPRIHVCDTMKFDQVPDVATAPVAPILDKNLGQGQVTIVAGSTHPGEEALICEAYRHIRTQANGVRLVLVPRHIERTPEVEALLKSQGLTWRLIRPADNEVEQPAPADVLIVNTTGELMNYYAAADIAIVGKSLAGQEGGHNIIEPAIYGKAIVHGPHIENFRAVAALFQERQAAIQLSQDSELEPTLLRLVNSPAERETLGRNARATVDKYRGAIERTLRAIAEA